MEVGENKTVYEGTLDQLYNNDFPSLLNTTDKTLQLLDKLDKKLKFIDLQMRLHTTTQCRLQTTAGAVAVTEQAIVNEAHRRGDASTNRVQHEGNTAAAGAYVAFQRKVCMSGFVAWT